jgi:predicted phage-related endonuclease
MKFTVIDAPQRSPEWFLARAGRLTGSMADTIIAKGRSGAESVGRRDYRLQLAAERLTGIPQEGGYVNADMQRGIDLEPVALNAYEAATGNMVNTYGFLSCDEVMAGCSLDGGIDGLEGILELKCPKTATHVGYLRNPDSLLQAYVCQVTHNLWVSGAKWCEIMSFDDRLPKPLQTVIVHVNRSEQVILEYAQHALQFLLEVDAEFKQLQALADGKTVVA